ncbi:MAG: hypothetical protein IT293_09495 [Deltaproteobacteria bacterium]|nr:hypothetical protein [Deltaproteobacteria bacterium]
MEPTRTFVVLAILGSLVAADAAADPIFASPPHVVADRDGARIVLFLNEPVSGALAARAGDGFEVRVPRSEVAPAIQGQDFGADGWGNGGDAVKHLVLAAGVKGDTSIRIQPSGAVHGIDARSVDDPPRLVIELLAAAPTGTAAPARTPKPTRTPGAAPTASARAASPAAKRTATKPPAATATPRPPRATAAAHGPAKPVPVVTPAASAREPVAVAAAGHEGRASDPASRAAAAHEPPSAEALARATVLTALSTTEDHGAAKEPAPAPAASASAPQPSSTYGLRCLWRRFAGTAICVADPKAAAYVGDHTITALVGALARGKLPEAEDTPTIVTPAAAFLAADVLFATRAPEGKLLPVVDAYRSALRAHPDFPDAWRVRLNIALAYRAMEFVTEMHTVAGEAAVDPTGGLVRGLAGDLAFLTGKAPIAIDDYRRASDMGGLGACLAARGRARLALADGNAALAAAELAALGALCPPEIASDAETVWVRGRLALAQGDVAAAKTLLGEAEKGLGRPDQGAVLVDLGAVAEAAHDPKGARRIYDRLAGGAHGARAARQATVRLALLDGVGGDVAAGLKRLERLTPEASDPARRTLVMQSARSALARGAMGEALATLHEAHVDPAALGLGDQLLVAEAYRGIGLYGEAERVLAAAQANAGSAAPDGLFAARGELALDRRDGAGALAVADEWIRTRGRSGGALALRARALALAGDGTAAHAAVAAAIIEDGDLTRPLSLDVAELLRERAPSVALALARQALEPGATAELPPARHAAGLALVGGLADDAGDDDTALAAFTTLAARYGNDPIAADAAYRAARIAARRLPGGDAAAFDEAAKAKDPLARRVAGAAREYEVIVKPLAGAGEEP